MTQMYAIIFDRPKQSYRGYTLELVQDHVTIYQGRQALYEFHKDWAGVNGWQRAREWVDDQIAWKEA